MCECVCLRVCSAIVSVRWFCPRNPIWSIALKVVFARFSTSLLISEAYYAVESIVRFPMSNWIKWKKKLTNKMNKNQRISNGSLGYCVKWHTKMDLVASLLHSIKTRCSARSRLSTCITTLLSLASSALITSFKYNNLAFCN